MSYPVYYSPATRIYSLEHFFRGDIWGGSAESRRFTTIENNIKSYLDFTGNGILNGWEVQELSYGSLSSESSDSDSSIDDIKLIVTPGTGIINAFFSESPYEINKRSEEVDGDVEVEVYPFQDTSETMDDSDPYVKVVNPYKNPLVIPNVVENGNYYVYADIPSGQNPYPKMEDFPPLAGFYPNINDYASSADYSAAVAEWNNRVEAIQNYEWQDNESNHFTAVEFSVSSEFNINSSRILLATIVVRDYELYDISLLDVQYVDNWFSGIENYYEEYIVDHVHGGPYALDPSAIDLSSDVRNLILQDYESSSNTLTFSIGGKYTTSVTLGHDHKYIIDSNGDGNTYGFDGAGNSHVHQISSSVISQQESSAKTVDNHVHDNVTYVADTTWDLWDDDTNFVIYNEGESYANQDSIF
jgi:hypothetical protein